MHTIITWAVRSAQVMQFIPSERCESVVGTCNKQMGSAHTSTQQWLTLGGRHGDGVEAVHVVVHAGVLVRHYAVESAAKELVQDAEGTAAEESQDEDHTANCWALHIEQLTRQRSPRRTSRGSCTDSTPCRSSTDRAGGS